MSRHRPSWTRSVGGSRGAVVALMVGGSLLAACGSSSSGSSSTTTAPSGSASAAVLATTDASSLGFPTIVQAAKTTSVADQKGCTRSVEAVYEDAAKKTGLVSDVLVCTSASSASKALAAARKKVTVDKALVVPGQLGATAFATASDAPEYLMVWQSGSRVNITALDTDVSATSSSPASALTPAQAQTLSSAAAKQNSLP